MNSTRFPDRDLDLSFAAASCNYRRVYMMFQEAISKYNDTDSGSQVSVEDYSSLFPSLLSMSAIIKRGSVVVRLILK